MDAPPTDLDFYLNLIRRWISDLGDAPAWSSFVFIDDLVLEPHVLTSVARSRVKSVDTVRAAFPSLVTSGLSWVQLEAWGLLAGDLIITIRVPDYRSPAPVASVNWGGSPNFVRERSGWDLSGLLKINDD